MPQPTMNQVHVNSPLTNISVAYQQSADQFVANKVFPLVPVDKSSNIIMAYEKHDWKRDEARLRAPGTVAMESGYNVTTTTTYTCKRYDLARVIPDVMRAEQDSPLDLDREATEWLTQQLMIRMERAWVGNNFVTSVWGTTATSTSLKNEATWDDYTSSDPIADIDTGVNTVLQNTGMKPNTLVCGWEVFKKLQRHPLIQEMYKYTSSDSVTTDMIAKVFDLKRVFACESTYTSDKEGDSTKTYSFIQGKNALLCYVADSPGVMTPSAGYTFVVRSHGGNDQGIRIKKWRDDSREADVIEASIYADPKLLASDLGYFFLSCVA